MQCNIISKDTYEKWLLELEEDKLADQLKQLCKETNSGKWSESDPSESATILHKLGKVYLKQSAWFSEKAKLQKEQNTDIEKILTTQRNQMFALIRCAALYNAAMVRSIKDKEAIETDLKHLCNHVLQISGAENSDTDLVEVAIQVKQKVQKMRKEAEQLLSYVPRVDNAEDDEQESKKISHVQYMQKVISDSYRNIMNDLAQSCLSIMGTAPCKFTIVGMGSLARDEVTPYSDFEHIIVLEDDCQHRNDYKEIVNYFRWYSVVFHLIIINLQETIIPSVDVYSLNDKSSHRGDWFYDDHTPRGISFDGLMPHASKFPLGRQETEDKPWSTELIKPVSKMLEYLNSAESIKSGYHLSDILTKTCYVFGDESVYKQFQDGVSKKLQQQTENELDQEIKLQLIKDLRNFGNATTDFDESPNKAFNMKTHIYRTLTVFISALGRREKIYQAPCYEIIDTLARRKKMSYYARHKLMYATAIACEVRLRWYINHGKAKDLLDLENEGLLEVMSDLVGESSTISYFQVMYALHCEISKRFQANQKSLSQSFMWVGKLWQKYKKDMHFEKKKTLDENLCLLQNKWVDETDSVSKKAEVSFLFCYLYLECGMYSVALAFISSAAFLFQDQDSRLLIAEALFSTGVCYRCLSKEKKALECLDRANNILIEASPTRHEDMGIVLNEIGLCYRNLYMLEEAEMCFTESYNSISQTVSISDERNKTLLDCLLNLVDCLILTNNIGEVSNHLMRALDVFNRISENTEPDDYIAVSHYKIGKCFAKLNNDIEALVHFQKSLQIFQNFSTDPQIDDNIATILIEIGKCLKDLYNIEDANASFLKARDILIKISENKNADKKLGQVFSALGGCKLWQKDFKPAVGFFKDVLQIYKKSSTDDESKHNEVFVLFKIARCLIEMRDFEMAKKELSKVQGLLKKHSKELENQTNLKTLRFLYWKMWLAISKKKANNRNSIAKKKQITITLM